MNKGEEMKMFNMISGLEIEVLGVQGLGLVLPRNQDRRLLVVLSPSIRMLWLS